MTLPRKGRRAVIGVDFGTLSGRAVVVDVDDGSTLGSAVHEYAHGVLTEALPDGGTRLPHDWALQVPGDYVDVLRNAVPKALAASGVTADEVIGVGTDFTACTILPALADGTPLSEVAEFADRPHAYVKLWRHHAAQAQADRINALAHERGEPWIARYGGKLSSEWALAKGLQLLEEDPEIYARMEHWVEAADWIIWRLCGTYVRNICTAGYKAVYQDGRYPSREFLAALNEGFTDFFDVKVAQPLGELGGAAGGLTEEAAR
jgi:L-ribulokinase